MLGWLSVWSDVQTCIWPSWCHCQSLSLASVKSRLVLPFWYRPTRVVPEKGPLNGCVCLCVFLTLLVEQSEGHLTSQKLFYFHRPVITDWGEVLHPCQHQIGHFGDVLLSQSLGLVPIFTYLTCIWCPHWRLPQWNFVKIFVIRKLESLYYFVVLFARSYV